MSIPAVRIQEAILDELQSQADADRPGAPYVDADQDPALVKIDGDVDVLAIAVRIAQLVNDR